MAGEDIKMVEEDMVVRMVDEDIETGIDLNEQAGRLEGEFRRWAGISPIEALPIFKFAVTGPDTGRPRFGILRQVAQDYIAVDLSLGDVAPAIVLREIIIAFVPAVFQTDIVNDVINRFCGHFLASFVPEIRASFNGARWQTLVQTHSRRYIVYNLGIMSITDLNVMPGSSAEYTAFFRVFLGKMRQHAPLIAPEQAGDVAAVIIFPILNSLWVHSYSPGDAAFAMLLSDYMATHDAFPTPKRLAGDNPDWSPKKCQDAMRRLEYDPLSPTYWPNPAALGLVYCWVLVEAPPATSGQVARQLIFLPFAFMTSSLCIGTPIPTYLNLYMLPPAQLHELGTHLTGLKKKGVILDYHVFRAERFFDVLNWGEILAVPSPAPLLSVVARDLGNGVTTPSKTLATFYQSWIAQQVLPWFGFRKYVPRAVTHWDPARNFASFLGIIGDAALLTSTTLLNDLSIVLPLLEQYRNVEYVLRLIDQAVALLRHLFDRSGSENLGPEGFGKLSFTWEYFPAREWLLGHFKANQGDLGNQAGILSQLALAGRILSFFAPHTIPRESGVIQYLQDRQQDLIAIIKADLARLPLDGAGRQTYFKKIHDQLVSDHLLLPKVSMCPLYPPEAEEFYFLARPGVEWNQFLLDFNAKIGPSTLACFVLQFRDQSGGVVYGGILRATRDQFKAINRSLAGAKGVLGPGASILIGRWVPFWDHTRRNYLETYDPSNHEFPPIGDYLALMRAEHLGKWAPPRSASAPFARQVLGEPFKGGIEKMSRARKATWFLKLTPSIIQGLKNSYLLGKPALHNFVKHSIGGRWSCDLDWPAYGLERYILHVFLSTRQPRYIYTHLVTPATRRVLASSAVSGFQTVLVDYLWPKSAPDDHFLQYLYSRTEKNVLAYSVHRVLSDTRFFNLDRLEWPATGGSWDNIDLQVLALARPPGPSQSHLTEFTYGGDARHAPGSAAWALAEAYFAARTPLPNRPELPPDSRPTFEFDPRAIGFSEKTALVFRGNFDPLPLCQALPFGHYYRTEEVAYEGTERLAGQPGHVIVFDFPATRMSHVNAFLNDILRNPGIAALSVNSYLAEQSLRKVDNLNLTLVNPLRCNPYNARTGTYYHLPKRILREGVWHVLSLKEQMAQLTQAWLRL